jgi:hypothetical protein
LQALYIQKNSTNAKLQNQMQELRQVLISTSVMKSVAFHGKKFQSFAQQPTELPRQTIEKVHISVILQK